MTIEHGAIMKILATPSSSSSRSPFISWQACENATCSVCMCTKVLGRFIGDVILAASIRIKKIISLFGWMLPSPKWNRCECCWLNLLFQRNRWAFPLLESGIHSAGELLHTPHSSRFRLPWTTVLLSKMNQHPWWYLMSVQLSTLGQTLGDCPQQDTSNGGILTYNWRESPFSKQPTKNYRTCIWRTQFFVDECWSFAIVSYSNHCKSIHKNHWTTHHWFSWYLRWFSRYFTPIQKNIHFPNPQS